MVYLRRTLIHALGAWLLVRASYLALALRAGLPSPASMTPGSMALLVLVVAGVTWLDLRRRNLTVLLPALGVSPWVVVLVAAAVAIAAESVLALVLG